jgi:hypothetical protein
VIVEGYVRVSQVRGRVRSLGQLMDDAVTLVEPLIAAL